MPVGFRQLLVEIFELFGELIHKIAAGVSVLNGFVSDESCLSGVSES